MIKRLNFYLGLALRRQGWILSVNLPVRWFFFSQWHFSSPQWGKALSSLIWLWKGSKGQNEPLCRLRILSFHLSGLKQSMQTVLSGLFEFSIASGEKDYLSSTGVSLIGSWITAVNSIIILYWIGGNSGTFWSTLVLYSGLASLKRFQGIEGRGMPLGKCLKARYKRCSQLQAAHSKASLQGCRASQVWSAPPCQPEKSQMLSATAKSPEKGRQRLNCPQAARQS